MKEAREVSACVGGSWTQVASEEVVELDQEQGLELVPPFPRLLGAEGPRVPEASSLLHPPALPPQAWLYLWVQDPQGVQVVGP